MRYSQNQHSYTHIKEGNISEAFLDLVTDWNRNLNRAGLVFRKAPFFIADSDLEADNREGGRFSLRTTHQTLKTLFRN